MVNPITVGNGRHGRHLGPPGRPIKLAPARLASTSGIAHGPALAAWVATGNCLGGNREDATVSPLCEREVWPTAGRCTDSCSTRGWSEPLIDPEGIGEVKKAL